MKLNEHWILLAAALFFVLGLICLNQLIGVPSEPAACDAGPMEAAQCRAQGMTRDGKGNWK
jgi:hypothetical protein